MRTLPACARLSVCCCFLLLIFLPTSACNDDREIPPPLPPMLEVVNGSGQDVQVGMEWPEPLEVRVLASNGGPMRGIEVNWAVASGGGTLTQSSTFTDQAGTARVIPRAGIVPGTQEIRASIPIPNVSPVTFSGFASAGPPRVLEISPVAMILSVGETGQCEVQVLDMYGNKTVPSGLTWISSNTAVASVDPQGLVRGMSHGTATITAELGRIAGSAEVNVVAEGSLGLIAHYDFSETGGSVLHDRSGNEHHGQIVGNPVWVSGRDEGALVFSGDDYVRIESTPLFESLGKMGHSWSTVILFRTGAPPTANPERHLFGNYYSPSGDDTRFSMHNFIAPDGRAVGNVRTSRTVEYHTATPASIADGAYHQVVAVADGSTGEYKTYLDGELVDVHSFNPGLDYSTSDPLHIGVNYSKGHLEGYFIGEIDDIRVYDLALSDQNVWELCSGLNLCEDLVAHYDFNEMGGSVLHDRSGHEHHGQIFGDPTWVGGLDEGALEFSGDDYVRIESSALLETLGEPGQSWSIAILFRAGAPPTSNPERHLFGNYYSSSGDDTRFSMHNFIAPDGRAIGNVRNSRTVEYHTATPISIVDESYHQVIAVANGTTGEFRTYLDGELVDMHAFDPILDYSTSDPLHIGVNFSKGRLEGFFIGEIDDIRVFKQALSDQDAADLCSFSAICG